MTPTEAAWARDLALRVAALLRAEHTGDDTAKQALWPDNDSERADMFLCLLKMTVGLLELQSGLIDDLLRQHFGDDVVDQVPLDLHRLLDVSTETLWMRSDGS